MHTQFSWDAPRGDMEATCRRAVEIGLPAIAFTDHADYVQGVHAGLHRLDITAYHQEVERCRALFPQLRILSGVELGEAHRYPAETAALLAAGPLDRVLGSIHCFSWAGGLMDGSQLGRLSAADASAAMSGYLDEMLGLVDSSQSFDALAHFDYPKRYWPKDGELYREERFEEQARSVLRALRARGTALELNTAYGFLCPGPTVLRWWVEEGGRMVTFGSDAHRPETIAADFALAAQIVTGLGFKPSDDPTDCWRR